MAIGKPGQSQGKAYSVKTRLKDGTTFLDCARFDLQEKQGDKYVTVQSTDTLDGDLFQVTTREGEYDGKPIRSFKLGLRDPSVGEAYFIDTSLGSSLGRNLANSILNLKAFDKVEIGLYGQKSKTNGKTYPAVAVRQGGSDETVKWAYDPKEGVLPEAETFKARGGKTEKDYTNQEIFLLEKLAEFGKALEKAPRTQNESAAPAAKEETPAPARKGFGAKATKAALAPSSQADEGDDSVPF